MSAATTEKATAEELEGALLLLVNDIRVARTAAEQRLNKPDIAISDMLVQVGKIAAYRHVLEVIERLAELYKLEL